MTANMTLFLNRKFRSDAFLASVRFSHVRHKTQTMRFPIGSHVNERCDGKVGADHDV
jgi:hypothetical protein